MCWAQILSTFPPKNMTPQEELHDRCRETETGIVLAQSDEMPVPLHVFALNRKAWGAIVSLLSHAQITRDRVL